MARVHQHLVEQHLERLVEVVASLLEALVEGPVVAEHLLVEPVEVLRVSCLVDLLGGQERLLALALVGAHQSGELGGDALLADEERREVPGHPAAVLLAEARPVGLVLLEGDVLRAPALALTQLVELLGIHQLYRAEIGLVGDRADIALAGELEQVGHPASSGDRYEAEGPFNTMSPGLSPPALAAVAVAARGRSATASAAGRSRADRLELAGLDLAGEGHGDLPL